MRKDITFDDKYFDKDNVVICDTVEQAKIFLTVAQKLGYMENFNKSSPEEEFRNYNKVGYSLWKSSYSNLEFWEREKKNFIPFNQNDIYVRDINPEFFL